MPTPKKAARFGGSPAHHDQILANLATELFRHGRIRTTHPRAKTVQPLAERMITFAKRGDVHARRQVLRVVRDRDVVHKLFADIGPAFADRDGGYTRVLKLGPRKGDAAPMALIELVEGVSVEGDGELAEQPRRRWSLRRRRGGTLSTGAREREEDLAAAVDRGEDLEVEPDEDEVESDLVDADEAPVAETPLPGPPAGAPVSGAPVSGAPTGVPPVQVPSPPSEAAGAGRDPDGVQADPAEVEARLAAEEEAALADADGAVEEQAGAGGAPEPGAGGVPEPEAGRDAEDDDRG